MDQNDIEEPSAVGLAELPESLRTVFELDDDEDDDEKSLRIVDLTQVQFDLNRPQIILYLQSVNPTLTSIKFNKCDLIGASYISIISQQPNITELDFLMCRIQPEGETQSTAMLKKLVRFQVIFDTSDDADEPLFIELIPRMLSATENLQTFQLDLSLSNGPDDSYAEIRRIVARQSRLKMLIIDDHRFFEGKLNNPQFQLNTFFMPTKQSHFNQGQLRNFYEFVATQTEISHLMCDVSVDYRSPDLEEIVTSFDSDEMEAFHDAFDQMEPNPFVKTFCSHISGENEDDHAEIIKTMVEKYPNIETMQLDYEKIGDKTKMDLLVPMNELRNLRSLSLISLSNRQISRLKVPTLISVEITLLEGDDIESLNRFIAHHSELEVIDLTLVEDDYAECMPGFYFFIEFMLIVLKKLKTVTVSLLDFQDHRINGERLQQMIDDNVLHDNFKLTIGFENNDAENVRENEVFVKTI